MFYSVYVLGKKGPLARVWLAAHWDKKITKAQILETNIVESVDSILAPRVKLSLRTSSHLLLGVVRIYARKTLYLLQDCQDAAFKIKSAFRPGVVDLPDGKTEAAIAAITLPETFDFDLIAEPPMQIEPIQTNANIKNITLSDDVISINVDDDLYMGQNIQNNWSDMSTVNSSHSKIIDSTLQPTSKEPSLWEMYDRPADDGFGDFGGNIEDVDDLFSLPIPPEMAAGGDGHGSGSHHHHHHQPEYQKNPIETEHNENGKLHENGQPMANGGGANTDNIDLPFDLDRPSSRMSDRSDSMSYGAPPSIAPSGPSSPGSIGGDMDLDMPGDGPLEGGIGGGGGIGLDDPLMHDSHEHERNQDSSLFPASNNNNKQAAGNLESMVLEPIEEGAGFERRKKRRKKLGIIIDEVKTLSGEEMKAQLSDTADIIADLDLAPPSKKLMYLKRTAGIEKLFANPIVPIPSKVSLNYYTRNLITSKLDRVEEERELAQAGQEYMNGNSSLHEASKHFELSQLDDIDPPGEFRRPDDFSIPDLEDNCPEPMLPPISPLREIQAPKTPRTPRRGETSVDKTGKKKRKNDTLDRTEKPPKTPRTDASERFANSQFSINFNENAEIERARRDESSHGPHLPQADSLMTQPEEDYEDHYEYEQPMSVGPPEEMMPDETADQFEERMRNKRTNVLLRLMANQLDEYGSIEFTHLVKNNRRKQVAQKFYSLLVLKKQQAIELDQDNTIAYGELVVNKGPRYDQALTAFSL